MKKNKNSENAKVKWWKKPAKEVVEATAPAPQNETEPEAAPPADLQLTPEQEKSAKKFKRKKTVKKWIKRVVGIILLLALIGGIIWFVKFKMSRNETAAPAQTTSVVTRGGFDSRVTGSGTVQPIESYTLTSLIEGKIISSPFDEGDYVNEGDLLYQFEDSEAQTRIQKAQTALRSAQKAAADAVKDSARKVEQAAKAVQTAQRNVEKAAKAVADAQKNIDKINKRISELTVKAPTSGMIEELNAAKGDKVSGTLCRIIDYNSLTTTVAFNSLQIQSINVGDRVTIGIASLMSSVGGSVEKKYNAPHAGGDGTIMYTVKIKVDSGVRLAAGTTVSVTVHTASGDVESPSYGTIAYAEPKDVVLTEGGEITALLAENGNSVTAGSVIARLSSEELEKELESANEAYQDCVIAYRDANDASRDAQEDYASAVSDQNSSSYEDAVKDAQSELDNAVKAAEDYAIKSPVTGVVLEKHYKAGDTYGSDGSNKTLMVVADMTTMVFTINVDELDISNIQVGQDVNITADALPGEFFMGKITKASKIGSGESGVSAYPIEISIDEPGNLMSGMNVTAEIVVGSVQDVLMAPASAVFMIDGQYFATIVTPSDDPEAPETEEQVPITVGLHNESFYEVIDGLKEGDVLRDSGIGSDDGMMGGMMYGW